MKRMRVAPLALLLALALISLGVPAALADLPSIVDATLYTYQITPIFRNYNTCLYVRTENPDPFSFRLVDADCDDASYEASKCLYADVRYENPETLRVHRGYIFIIKNGKPNGGSLKLQHLKCTGSFVHYGVSRYIYSFEDTSVTVTVRRS